MLKKQPLVFGVSQDSEGQEAGGRHDSELTQRPGPWDEREKVTSWLWGAESGAGSKEASGQAWPTPEFHSVVLRTPTCPSYVSMCDCHGRAAQPAGEQDLGAAWPGGHSLGGHPPDGWAGSPKGEHLSVLGPL